MLTDTHRKVLTKGELVQSPFNTACFSQYARTGALAIDQPTTSMVSRQVRADAPCKDFGQV